MKEKIVKPPKFLQFLLGKKISVINLTLFVLFALLSATAIILCNKETFLNLNSIYKIIYVIVLVFTLFSVVINITPEISKIHENNYKFKLCYIFFSVQPLILSLISGYTWWHFVIIWGYTTIMSLIITFLKSRGMQKAVGFATIAFYLLFIGIFFQDMPSLYSLLLVAHVVNVVFCVSVNQYIDPQF